MLPQLHLQLTKHPFPHNRPPASATAVSSHSVFDMAYWQNTPTDAKDRLIELASLFTGCREAFHETADRFQWIAHPGSPGAHDATELPSPDPSIAEARGETGHRMIAEVFYTYLLTASGHLGGLASLYSSGEVFFSPPALIRATIENCAHAVWVLGDKPEEPSENRLARAYLEELLSAEKAKKNAGRMRPKTDPSFMLADTTYKVLKRQIVVRFPGTDQKDLGQRTLGGQALLGPEQTVAWMYALAESSGGTIGVRAASGIYGYFSNMTHPTLYPARQKRSWKDDPVTGGRVADLHVNMGSVEGEARAALAAFYNALNYTTSYFGWPKAVVDDLTAKIERSIPTFFI